MHLTAIPSWKFTPWVPCRMALQAKLGLAGKELHGACDPGTTTACSCFLIFAARCLISLISEVRRAIVLPQPFCCPQGLSLPLYGKASLEVKTAWKKSKEEVNTQNLIPPFSSLYLLVWQCGHEGEEANLFSFHCFLCCQKYISPWPCSGLHLGLIIIECGLLIEVVDSNQCFSINSFVTTIFKITRFSFLL